MIHILRFGNFLRKMITADYFLSFINAHGGLGAPVQIPMTHKHDGGARSYYLTLDFRIRNSLDPDEIIGDDGVSTGGRIHPRIGDRYQDSEEIQASGDETVVTV